MFVAAEKKMLTLDSGIIQCLHIKAGLRLRRLDGGYSRQAPISKECCIMCTKKTAGGPILQASKVMSARPGCGVGGLIIDLNESMMLANEGRFHDSVAQHASIKAAT